jgi:hypothetical protein
MQGDGHCPHQLHYGHSTMYPALTSIPPNNPLSQDHPFFDNRHRPANNPISTNTQIQASIQHQQFLRGQIQ